MEEKIFEQLSELEHEQWCNWAGVISVELEGLVNIIDKFDEKYTDVLDDEDRELVTHVKDRLNRWEKLLIPYEDLPEDEKDKDRVYAQKIADLFR